MTTMILTHRLHFSFALFTFCWWRHHWLLLTSQLPEYCDATHASMWKIIFNSFDLDFVYSYSHGQTCKNNKILWHSFPGYLYFNIQDIIPQGMLQIYTYMTAIYSRGQQVNLNLYIDIGLGLGLSISYPELDKHDYIMTWKHFQHCW